MPPPPMNPQGSRAGLITAVVILSILFVTSAIFAFYYSAEHTKEAQTAQGARHDHHAVRQRCGPGRRRRSPPWRPTPRPRSKSAIELLNDQKNALAKAITGNSNQPADVAAKAAIAAASDPKLAPDRRHDHRQRRPRHAVTNLADRLRAIGAENQQKDKQLADATARLKQETDLRQKMQQELGASSSSRAPTRRRPRPAHRVPQPGHRVGLEDPGRGRTRTEGRPAAGQQGPAGARPNRQGENAKLQKQIETLNSPRARRREDERGDRPPARRQDPPRAGQRQRVHQPRHRRPDRAGHDVRGVRPLRRHPRRSAPTPTPAAPPSRSTRAPCPRARRRSRSCGSSARQSECRIIRQTQGQTIIEGDLIANVVYDTNTKYNFVVFGDFDLDQDNVPTPGDADVVQRLRHAVGRQPGGQRRASTPTSSCSATSRKCRRRTRTKAPPTSPAARRCRRPLDAYEDVRDRAIDLNIPILNQNRFLYYTGYYEQSQR